MPGMRGATHWLFSRCRERKPGVGDVLREQKSDVDAEWIRRRDVRAWGRRSTLSRQFWIRSTTGGGRLVGRAEATDLGTSSALRIMGRQWMLRLSTTSTDVASAGKPSSTLTQQFNGQRNIRSSCKCEHCVPELFAPPSLSGFHLRYVAISHNPVGIRTPGAQECQPMNLSRETRLDGPIDRTSENAGGIVMVLERFSLSASPWRQ